MNRRTRTVVATAALVASASIALGAQPAAAAPGGCNSSNAVCVYDHPGWKGDWEAVGCGILERRGQRLQRLGYRVSSVVNGCRFAVSLFDDSAPPRARVVPPRWVGPKQWRYQLGGALKFDNRTSGLLTPSLFSDYCQNGVIVCS